MNSIFRYRRILIVISLFLTIAVAWLAYKKMPGFLNSLPGANEENFRGILVPYDENDGVYSNIIGYEKGDSIILFMPCRADVTNLIFYATDTDGNYLEKYIFDFTSGSLNLFGKNIVCMQSNLPSVEIVTNDDICSMDQVEKDVSHNSIAYGDMTVTATKELADTLGFQEVFKSHNSDINRPLSVSIKGRGNSSWEDDKKPFVIELEREASLLNMESGKKWVLISNSLDHTLLRNEVFLNLAKELDMADVSDVQPVDLFINGEYRGTYDLASKVETVLGRSHTDPSVDIMYRLGMKSGVYRQLNITYTSDAERAAKANPDLQELYLEDEGLNYAEIVNPKSDVDNERAFALVQELMDSIDNTAGSRSLDDIIDFESWAKYYWLQEFAKNTDAAYRSFYINYDAKKDKFYVVSPWDFDRTVGTIEPILSDLDYSLPTDWTVRGSEWFVPLFEHENFKDYVYALYEREGIQDKFQCAINELPDRISYISRSAIMNFTRWDHLERNLEDMGYYNKIEYFMGDKSYDSEIIWLTEWLKQRAEWIDETIAEEQ